VLKQPFLLKSLFLSFHHSLWLVLFPLSFIYITILGLWFSASLSFNMTLMTPPPFDVTELLLLFLLRFNSIWLRSLSCFWFYFFSSLFFGLSVGRLLGFWRTCFILLRCMKHQQPQPQPQPQPQQQPEPEPQQQPHDEMEVPSGPQPMEGNSWISIMLIFEESVNEWLHHSEFVYLIIMCEHMGSDWCNSLWMFRNRNSSEIGRHFCNEQWNGKCFSYSVGWWRLSYMH